MDKTSFMFSVQRTKFPLLHFLSTEFKLYLTDAPVFPVFVNCSIFSSRNFQNEFTPYPLSQRLRVCSLSTAKSCFHPRDSVASAFRQRRTRCPSTRYFRFPFLAGCGRFSLAGLTADPRRNASRLAAERRAAYERRSLSQSFRVLFSVASFFLS